MISYQTGAVVLYHLLHISRFFSFVTQRGRARLVFDVVDEHLAGKLHDRDRRDAEGQVLIDRLFLNQAEVLKEGKGYKCKL